MKILEKPEVGTDYSHGAIDKMYEADDLSVSFVVVKRGHIVALRLREDFNPNIFANSAEVWVGADDLARKWGNPLANDTGLVPVFVKKAKRRTYTFFGRHQVLDRAATEAELASARARIAPFHKRGVSRIVFLKKV